MTAFRGLLPLFLVTGVAIGTAITPVHAEDDCADAWITAKLKTRLMGKSGFGAFKINIDTEECVVTLNGCVDTEGNRQRATSIAKKVKGVRDVRNELTICSADPDDEESECPDALITAEVKSLIFGMEGFTAFKIDVDTEECVVTLDGCVGNEAQIREAVKAARKAKGVKDVASRLKTCPS